MPEFEVHVEYHQIAEDGSHRYMGWLRKKDGSFDLMKLAQLPDMMDAQIEFYNHFSGLRGGVLFKKRDRRNFSRAKNGDGACGEGTDMPETPLGLRDG